MSLIVSKTDEENDLPDAADSYKSGTGNISAPQITDAPTASQTFDKIGTAAAEFNDADTGIIDSLNNSPAGLDNETIDNTSMSWIIPAALLFLLIILGYAFCGGAPTV